MASREKELGENEFKELDTACHRNYMAAEKNKYLLQIFVSFIRAFSTNLSNLV